MKINFLTFLLLILAAGLQTNCGREKTFQTQQSLQTERPDIAFSLSSALPSANINPSSLLRTLDELAELERAGSWIQGMALTESTIRENLGDYTGAVAAAAKELAWAYGLGLIQKEELEQGLLNVLAVNGEDTVTAAANAILTFFREKWNEAAIGLGPLFNHLELDEPDGFGRWMLLVCVLEQAANEVSGTENINYRRADAAYRSIRARYAQFPEYWYRGARAFSGVIAAEFAENCINTAPSGPFSEECRSILAIHSGLRTEDGSSIKTMREVDVIIAQAVNSGNAQPLNALLPLLSLPDNPYTVYAVGALRPLTGVQRFREYFIAQAADSGGRLTERLSYISRS